MRNSINIGGLENGKGIKRSMSKRKKGRRKEASLVWPQSEERGPPTGAKEDELFGGSGNKLLGRGTSVRLSRNQEKNKEETGGF